MLWLEEFKSYCTEIRVRFRCSRLILKTLETKKKQKVKFKKYGKKFQFVFCEFLGQDHAAPEGGHWPVVEAAIVAHAPTPETDGN